MTTSAGFLEVEAISKAFGASQALRDVSFSLSRGEVHALVGENGAGKSTLMKILSGAIRPDSGLMRLEGSSYAPKGPRDALRLGVAMIYQELAIAPHLSVDANVMLGQETTRAGFIRKREHRRKVREILEIFDHPEIGPDRIARTLSTGAQQLVEVARALVSDARVLIFDEPTSSLTEHDTVRLFDVIRRLRSRGIGIVYISHFLEEVKAISDRYTVLRDGTAAGGGLTRDADPRSIVAQMIGREIDEIFPKIPHTPGEVLLDLNQLAPMSKVSQPSSLQIRRGEIFGIAGLVGSGRTEFLRALYGLDPVASGTVRLGTQSTTASGTPRQRIRQGMGFVSEDRKTEGVALGRSIEDNVTYSALSRHSRLGWLNLSRRRAAVSEIAYRVKLRARGPDQKVGELSGGNQQKVALARLLHQNADLFLLDDPTRGIDVGSKAEIYRLIGELAARGVTIIMVSSYLPELFGVCDRLAVMCRGKLSEARPISEWTEHSVMVAATSS